MQHSGKYFLTFVNPPMSKGSREVANLTERKNPHTPIKAAIFCRQSMETQNGNFTKDYLNFHLSSNQNQKTIEKS